MPSVITDADLRRETPDMISARIAQAHANGQSDRQILTFLAIDAMHAAEDAAYWLRTWLADGWNGDPVQIPTAAPTDIERDRQLLAAMVGAANAAARAGSVRARQHIDRGHGWDPLRTLPLR